VLKRVTLLAILVFLVLIVVVGGVLFFARVYIENTASSGSGSVDNVTPISANVIVLGYNDFRTELQEVLRDRVRNIIALDKVDESVARYAGRDTIVIISDEWLVNNAERSDVRELIKVFAESGSLIYVFGPGAGQVLNLLDETGVERFPRIPEEVRGGMGYLKVSEDHDVVIYGATIENLLNVFIEYRG